MRKALAVALLLAGTVAFAHASVVPEIDPGSAGSAIALIGGVLLMFSARRKQ